MNKKMANIARAILIKKGFREMRTEWGLEYWSDGDRVVAIAENKGFVVNMNLNMSKIRFLATNFEQQMNAI